MPIPGAKEEANTHIHLYRTRLHVPEYVHQQQSSEARSPTQMIIIICMCTIYSSQPHFNVVRLISTKW
jgi:hypothetical protein